MSRAMGTASCVLMVLLGVAVSAQERQPLEYHCSEVTKTFPRAYLRGQTPALSEKPPEGLSVPTEGVTGAFFGKWVTPMVEAGHLWLMVARSKQDGPYDRIVIDSDGDGSLTDETPAEPWRLDDPSGKRASFGPIKVTVKGEKGPAPYHLNATVYSRGARPSVYLRPGCWREGRVQFGGMHGNCFLLDCNTDGRFNEASLDLYSCDKIVIHKDQSATPWVAYVGKYYQLDYGGELFRLDIAPDGSSVSFKWERNLPKGAVWLPADLRYLHIHGENGFFVFSGIRGQVLVPPGTYRFKYLEYTRADEFATNWTLGISNFPRGSAFEVKLDEAAEPLKGEPLISELQVRKVGGRYEFQLRLRPRVGGWVDPPTPRGAEPGEFPPKLRIVDAKGAEVGRFGFTHRYSGYYVAKWTVPPDAQGPFTATAEMLGPFKLNANPVTIEAK